MGGGGGGEKVVGGPDASAVADSPTFGVAGTDTDAYAADDGAP
jgi:hypothetical protein